MKNYFKIAASFVFVVGVMGISVSTIFAYSSGPPDGCTGARVRQPIVQKRVMI